MIPRLEGSLQFLQAIGISSVMRRDPFIQPVNSVTHEVQQMSGASMSVWSRLHYQYM